MHTLVFLSTRQVLQCQPAACQALPQLPLELFPLLFKVAFMDKKTVVLRELVHTWPFPPAQLPAAAAGVRPLQPGPAAGAAQHRERAGGDPGAHSPAPHPGGRGWHTVLLQEARTAGAGHDGPPGRRCGAGPRHHEHVGLHGSSCPHVRGTASGWDRGARADPCSRGGACGPSGEPGLLCVPAGGPPKQCRQRPHCCTSS